MKTIDSQLKNAHHEDGRCLTADHWNRRTLLKAFGMGAGLSWLTPVAEQLAMASEGKTARSQRAKSVIVLWLQGGPSQLETFDPHPGTKIGGDTKSIKTTVADIEIGSGLEQTAEQMEHISIVRAVKSREGDHERATYNVKTGFRPDPTLVHPSLGAIVCHQLQDKVEIPRHISILANQWSGRGGYLGAQYDSFRIHDPKGRIPDVKARVSDKRQKRRVDDLLNIVEPEFAQGRLKRASEKTQHIASMQAALTMMSSEQLKAFDINQAPKDLRESFGDTPFGRGCLAAVQLIETGVRCVEVTLDGWDSHVNNHSLQHAKIADLDPALATLVAELKRRDLLDETLVLCGGEFGRTPFINPAGGRDHWPHGFSIALAGGGIQGGRGIGKTSPNPIQGDKNPTRFLRGAVEVENIHKTVLHLLGIDSEQMLDTPVGRPMRVMEGDVIKALL